LEIQKLGQHQIINGLVELNMNYYSNGVDTDFLWPGVQWVEKESEFM
jgi:hypothetical protein